MSSRDDFQPELFNDHRSIIILKGLRDGVATSYLEVLMPQFQLLEGEAYNHMLQYLYFFNVRTPIFSVRYFRKSLLKCYQTY